MIRKHKKYSNPRKRYDSVRISEENALVERYALKNKREIWKFEAKVRYFRNRAKALITARPEEQQALFKKLVAIGLPIQSVSDVLALTKEDLLKRRLTSVLAQRGLARTPREARQMISHKRVRIHGKAVSAPGYLVKTHDENAIQVKQPVLPIKQEEEPIHE